MRRKKIIDTRMLTCPAPVLDQTIPPRLGVISSRRKSRCSIAKEDAPRIDIGFGKDPVPYLRQVTRIQGVDGIADGRKIAISAPL